MVGRVPRVVRHDPGLIAVIPIGIKEIAVAHPGRDDSY
jgi:hypothetical protein